MLVVCGTERNWCWRLVIDCFLSFVWNSYVFPTAFVAGIGQGWVARPSGDMLCSCKIFTFNHSIRHEAFFFLKKKCDIRVAMS
jgi:hypothetical protein